MRLSRTLPVVSTLFLIGLVADAAPVDSKPGTSPVRPSPGLAPSKGTLAGTITLTTPIGDPVWVGTCADMTVYAKPASGNPIPVIATGDVATRKCAYTVTVAVGKWSLEAHVAGKNLIAAPVTDREVTKDQTNTTPFSVNFPTSPIAVVRGTVDIGGTAVQCGSIKMKIVHALKTQEKPFVNHPNNSCFADATNVPHGAVTVSIIGMANPPAPQQANAAATVTNLAFTLPKFATIRARLRPADYPAMHNPEIPCGPYSLNVKKDGVTVITAAPNASANSQIECTMQTNSLKVPANVPLVLELLKNGTVVKTDAVGPLAPSQFLDHVYQPMP